MTFEEMQEKGIVNSGYELPPELIPVGPFPDPEAIKKKNKTANVGSRGNYKAEKQELDDIQKLIEEINALEAKRGFYLSSYPEYLGIQVKLLDDIKKKQEELNDLRGTSLKQVSLSGFEIPEETPGLRESALSVLNDIAMEKARTQLELLTTKAENLRDALMPMTDAFGKFFGVLANGESTGNAFKELLKTIATQFISFLEIQYFASAASTFFKAILSAGLTLTSDLVWQFLGLSALETAKGLIGALETGGPVNKSGMYLVGESGPEIRYLNAGGGVMNNNDTMRYLNARQNNSSNIVNQINVQVSGLLRDLVKVGIEQVNQRNAVLDY